MLYRAYIEGFTHYFDTVEDLADWLCEAAGRFGLIGKTVKIWKAEEVFSDGSGAQYNAIPSRSFVIGAL